MTFEYIGAKFETTPARPAPSPEFIPSPNVVQKLAEMLLSIQEIKAPDSTGS